MNDINEGSLVLCRYVTHDERVLINQYGLVIQMHQDYFGNQTMYVVLVNAKAEFLFIDALSGIT
mgnify:CR=1 FL=1